MVDKLAQLEIAKNAPLTPREIVAAGKELLKEANITGYKFEQYQGK